jgi:hypothetical protein
MTNKSFQEKPWFRYQRSRKWTSVYLSILDSFISEIEIQLNLELAANIKEHRENVMAYVKEYCPGNLTLEFCIRDPFFIEDFVPELLIMNEKDELI